MNMRKALFVVLIALLIAGGLFAQRSGSFDSSSKSRSYELTVNANVSDFRVYVDGREIKGNRIEVKPGNHNITVRADGYFDWSQRVNVNQNQNVYASLQPREFRLTINSNIKGADVYIDGNRRGSTGFQSELAPGNYNIRVSQFGYNDYTTTVNLNGNREIYAELQPAYARVRVEFPDSVLNPRDKGARDKVDIYIDGNMQKGRSFQLMPGEHRIQIVSGGFSMEGTFTFQPGQDYTIEPSLSLGIE
jgi:hypothetical protein